MHRVFAYFCFIAIQKVTGLISTRSSSTQSIDRFKPLFCIIFPTTLIIFIAMKWNDNYSGFFLRIQLYPAVTRLFLIREFSISFDYKTQFVDEDWIRTSKFYINSFHLNDKQILMMFNFLSVLIFFFFDKDI